jgi:hypothetical protein
MSVFVLEQRAPYISLAQILPLNCYSIELINEHSVAQAKRKFNLTNITYIVTPQL